MKSKPRSHVSVERLSRWEWLIYSDVVWADTFLLFFDQAKPLTEIFLVLVEENLRQRFTFLQEIYHTQMYLPEVSLESVASDIVYTLTYETPLRHPYALPTLYGGELLGEPIRSYKLLPEAH